MRNIAKKRKNNLSMKILASILIVSIISLSFIYNILEKHYKSSLNQESDNNTIEIKSFQDEEYYIIKEDYSGEYDLQYIFLSTEPNFDANKDFIKQTIFDYEEYKEYCQKWNLKQNYTDSKQKYIIFSYATHSSMDIKARLAALEYIDKKVKLYVWDKSVVTASVSGYVIIIPTNKDINSVEIQSLYTADEFEYVKTGNFLDLSVDKPILYLYPKDEMQISVKLGYPESLTSSYPKYSIDGWNVLAKPNGDLIELDSNRKLYALYYENNSNIDFKIEKDGFIVQGKDVATFLEEKLSLLGLNEKEAEEFIVYWLPKLEKNKYNYIRFATKEEIEDNMPIKINPQPDTFIRILMTFKGLDYPFEIEEQKLIEPERKGYIAVEWGGTELK